MAVNISSFHFELLFVVALFLHGAVLVSSERVNATFSKRSVRQCSLDQLTRTDFSGCSSLIRCTFLCSSDVKCLAAIYDAPTGLCSIYVNTTSANFLMEQLPNCNQAVAAYVRHTDTIIDRCPADYTLHDARWPWSYYKVITATYQWAAAKQNCETDSIGSKLAQIISSAEMTYVQTSAGRTYVGGFQPPGSLEPAVGWIWTGSGEPVNVAWYGSQPSNSGGSENVLESIPGLNDISETTFMKSICECILM